MYTYVPGLPPLQVKGSPWVLSILAEGLGAVEVNSGFDKLIVEVKGPTSAPPEPVNVKVPPVWGIAPAGNCEKKVPLMPSWEPNVIAPGWPGQG